MVPAKVGNGYAGPAVAQGRVFVHDHVFDPEVERVLCFDEATGKPLWVHSYPTSYKDMEYGYGPRASPTVHKGKVYALGTQGHLVCLDAATGEVVWKRSLTEDFHGKNPRYGASAAPLVVGELLIVCAGGQPDASVVALDRRTGELRWQALADRPAYSAPIVIHAGGVQQLIVWTAAKELGEFTGHTNRVFASAFSPDGQMLATGSADQTVRLWDVATRKQRAVLPGHSDAIWSVAFSADGKTVASASADRTVKLWDASTGEERGISALALSPDDRTLASAGMDDAVRLWTMPRQP